MSATAKLFMHGRSQAVRLPEEFRFEGTEVRISKVGDKVILEPLKKQPIELDKFWAELDARGQGISCRTASRTIRRSNPIRVFSSTNDLCLDTNISVCGLYPSGKSVRLAFSACPAPFTKIFLFFRNPNQTM
jgi:antitoxin VapB